MSALNITSDIKEIRNWVEGRNGFPVILEEAKPEDSLYLVFNNSYPKEKYRKISWEEFSEKLENLLLTFQYEESSEDNLNYKFVSKSNN